MTINVGAGWSSLRARGPERLAVTLGIFLAGFFLLPSNKALNNVYYALVLAPALFLLRGTDWRWLAGSGLWRVAMLLLAYLTVSGLWSADVEMGNWLQEAKGLPYLAVYLAVLACVCARRPKAWGWLLRALVVAAVVGTVFSAIAFYSKWPLTWRIRYYGALYQPVEAATVLGCCLLVALEHLLPASSERWRKAFWLACAAVIAAGIGLTGSRMPLAAALLCIALGLVLRRQWRLLVIMGALAGLAGALVAHTDAARLAMQRGDSLRLAIWQHYLPRVADRPWLGEGLLTDETTQLPPGNAGPAPTLILHPHNVYLATALYGGLPALAMLLVMIALALRQGWRGAMRGGPVWLLVLLFALLCMMTDGDRLLNAPRAIWFYFWLPVGVLIAQDAVARAGMATVATGLGPAAGHRTE